jgi:hypothetical protein
VAIVTNVAGSGLTRLIAAVEAIRRFEGPKKGMRLNPKATRKVIINSINGHIPAKPYFSVKA